MASSESPEDIHDDTDEPLSPADDEYEDDEPAIVGGNVFKPDDVDPPNADRPQNGKKEGKG